MLHKTDFTKLLCQQYVLYFLAIALKSQGRYSYHFVRWYKWFIIALKKRKKSLPTSQLCSPEHIKRAAEESAERRKNIFNISTFYACRKKLHFQTSYCENHIPHKQPEATNVKAKTVSPPTAPCSDCTQGLKQISKVPSIGLKYKCLNMWHCALQ